MSIISLCFISPFISFYFALAPLWRAEENLVLSKGEVPRAFLSKGSMEANHQGLPSMLMMNYIIYLA